METMLRRCHLVPLLALAAALSGCYLGHGGPSGRRGRDAGRTDGGAPHIDDAGGGFGDGSFFDAGMPTSCAPRAPDFVCTDTGNGSVPVGVPYALPVAIGDLSACFCGETVECDAAIVEPGLLEIQAGICSDHLCGACFPFIHGVCELPPLTEGAWTVRMDGRNVLTLNVSDALPFVGPVDRCATLAQEDPACEVAWMPHTEPVDQICLPARMPSGMPIPIEVTDFCLGCAEATGSCEVTRTANEIEVRPQALPPICDIDCDGCTFNESRCVIPPLPAGTYLVRAAGLTGSIELSVEDDIPPSPGRACLSAPED